MSLSILPVSQIFGRYEQQARMAELNRKSPVKTIQMQVDRVTISPEALKKRAIDKALKTIQTSNQGPTKTKPAPGEHVESISYADRVVQNALNKSNELKEKEKANLESQSDSVREKFLKKSIEIKEKAEKEKKEREAQEATPF